MTGFRSFFRHSEWKVGQREFHCIKGKIADFDEGLFTLPISSRLTIAPTK
jgi:hypothetical protein